MQKSPQAGPKDGFGIQDVLYILFKHKWKIIILSLLGFSGAAAVYANRRPLYQSQAKLMLEYVLHRDPMEPAMSQMNAPGGPGDQVMTSEIEILNSEVVAMEVAKKIGADRIVPEAAGQATDADAAATILGNLVVAALPGSNVIHVSYSSPNPQLSKDVLGELMEQYSVKHIEIHRNAAIYDKLTKESEELNLTLRRTENELEKLRTTSGITALADVTKEFKTQEARTTEELMVAKAELAEQAARVSEVEKAPGMEPAGPAADPAKPLVKPVPPNVVTEYKTLIDMLGILQKRDMELRLKFKSGNRLVSMTQQQIGEYDARKRALVEKYPQLIAEAALLERDPKNPGMDVFSEKARLASVTAKVELYKKLQEETKKQYSEQYAVGKQIDELENRRQMEESEYRTLKTNLKNAILDKTLDPTRMPNINVFQPPTQPVVTYDKITQKIVFGLAGGGMALGLGIAFMIELLFDRRIKRPTEIQARLQLPLLLSIPYIKRKERGGLMLSHESTAPRIGHHNDHSEITVSDGKLTPEAAVRKANHFILPYSETIRDRIIFNFEVNNIVHKPKLVAVAGLSEGAGASTIAAGLAKSFSEINGAKVLLVDLSSYHPEDSPIFGEVPRHSLSGALQLARSNKFKDNTQSLYYASATARRDDSGLTTFSPMHLYELMPHLQASEFDYIVFDMPPIDQTSRTLTMAGLMDKVLLVLDAENTSRDALKWGYSELVKGRADVSCIFNKTRSHAPDWLIGKS